MKRAALVLAILAGFVYFDSRPIGQADDGTGQDGTSFLTVWAVEI